MIHRAFLVIRVIRDIRRRVDHLFQLFTHLKERSSLRADVNRLTCFRIPTLPGFSQLDLKAPESSNLDALAPLSASIIESKIVLTTTSVSFFEICGVRLATSSIKPLLVISLPRLGQRARASSAPTRHQLLALLFSRTTIVRLLRQLFGQEIAQRCRLAL